MKHPSHYFIKWLIVQGHTFEPANAIMKDHGLPEMPDRLEDSFYKFTDEVWADLPADFTYVDPMHKPSSDFLKRQDIYNLAFPTKHTIAALRVLEYGPAKRDIVIALLGRIKKQEIISIANDVHGLDIDEKVIDALAHYYYNVKILTLSEWAQLMPSFAAQETDQYLSALNGGPVVAAYRLNRAKNVTIRETMQTAVDALFATLSEIRNWPATTDKVKILAETVGALAKAHTVMNTSDQELATIAKELKQFKLARNATKPVSLQVLSGGAYQNSGQDRKEIKNG